MVQAVASTTGSGITIRRRHPLIGAETAASIWGRSTTRPSGGSTTPGSSISCSFSPNRTSRTRSRSRSPAASANSRSIPRPSTGPAATREIYRVSIVDEHGSIIPQESKGWRYMNLTWLWHTDSSFREVPSMGSILHGIEVPPDGGDTLFANMYAVYEALSDDMKERVRGLRVLHSHDQVLRS